MSAREKKVESGKLDYVSKRVFAGVRILNKDAAQRHRNRVKRATPPVAKRRRIESNDA
ncbi:MAG: hypothetical protein P1U65_14840 [Minwuia sp.]|nr:hypothetical protein [Minwuia sp.]